MKDLLFYVLRFLLIASLWTLSGCGPSGDSYPTPIPTEILPTVVAQTAEAINATARAAFTATPLPTFTPIPTVTFTPPPMPPAPRARLLIESPGPMSRLVSPLRLQLFVIPGETGLAQAALYGEDGRLLARDVVRIEDVPPPGANLYLEIPFEVRVAELARLELRTTDELGRVEKLVSQQMTLLPDGLNQLTPGNPPFDRAAIYNLADGAPVYGGVIAVEGAFWPINDQPVILELQDESGRILMTRQLSLAGDTHIPFSTTVPYTVSKPTPARLSLRQMDPRFNAIAYLFSIEVVLNP